MNASWLLTPHFFDDYDPGLAVAAPDNAKINGPHEISDRSPNNLKVIHAPIVKFVRDAVVDGCLPVSVAGDCVASIPVMSGLQAAGLNPQLVWLDGHADFNTPETSPSQFLGGMPLAMMVGRGSQEICENLDLKPISQQDVWLVGARDNHYPVSDGPSSSELIAACTKFIMANNVVAISFSGWNSHLQEADRTGTVCAKVLQALVAAATADHQIST